jgi:hypothetical protein
MINANIPTIIHPSDCDPVSGNTEGDTAVVVAGAIVVIAGAMVVVVAGAIVVEVVVVVNSTPSYTRT